jgi:hypothetical protein
MLLSFWAFFTEFAVSILTVSGFDLLLCLQESSPVIAKINTIVFFIFLSSNFRVRGFFKLAANEQGFVQVGK